MANGMVWLYLVVSSDKQEATIEHQRAWAMQLAREKGWNVEREFGGVATGKSGPRSVLVRLISDLKGLPVALRPEWIVMTRTDRVGRGRGTDSLVALHEIIDMGVRIWTRDGGEVKLDSAADEMIAAVLAGVARLENEKRQDKSRSMHARKKGAGEPQSFAPYGFIRVGNRFTPYAPESAFIREIFGLRLRRWSYGKLSRYALEHAPAKRMTHGGFKQLKWAMGTVLSLLRNPIYRGTVVDEETFDACQLLRRSEPLICQTAIHPWPMRGAIRCICGLRVTGRIANFRRKTHHRYYACPDYAKHYGSIGHPADKVEQQFLALLRDLVFDPSLILNQRPHDEIAPLLIQKHSLEQERESAKNRKERVWQLFEDSRIPHDEVANRLSALGKEIERADTAIHELDRRIEQSKRSARMMADVAESLAFAVESWATLNVGQQKEIANAVAALIPGGLWLDPTKPGQLLYWVDRIETQGKVETKSSDLTHTIAKRLGDAVK